MKKLLQPASPEAWREHRIVSTYRARVSTAFRAPDTPSPWRKSARSAKQFFIYLVQDGIILGKLSSKWGIAIHHFIKVLHCQREWMLLWRIVPSNVMEVMAYCSVSKFVVIADYSVKIALGR